MAKLLRELQASTWTDLLNIATINGSDCSGRVLKSLGGGDKISLWRVTDREGVVRVARTLALSRKKVSEAQYILLDSADLKTGGLTLQDSPQKQIDSSINQWHTDIVDISAVKLIWLAKHIHFLMQSDNQRAPSEKRLISLTKNEIEKECLQFLRQSPEARRLFWAEQKDIGFELIKGWYCDGLIFQDQ